MPEGVVGLADDVERHTLLNHIVEEPLVGENVATAVHVQHDRNVGTGRILNTGHTRLQKSAEPLPRLPVAGRCLVFPVLRIRAVARGNTPMLPKHAGSNLVADLHHFRRRPFRDKAVHGFARIHMDGVRQASEIKRGPRFRGVLLPGIGPRIGVMQVEQILETGLLQGSRQRQSVR